MKEMTGTPVGGGIVLGRACVLATGIIDVPRYSIELDAADGEIERLERACAWVNDELLAVADQLPPDAPAEARALLDVQMMMLNDPALMDAAAQRVRTERINVEWAISEMADEWVAQFKAMDDPYLRERGRDVEQVAERVLAVLSGSPHPTRPQMDGDELIFVARDLQPADMLQLKSARGYVFEQGSITSHSAILARSLRVPAVTAVEEATQQIQDGDMLILDGDEGLILVAPDEATLDRYRRLQQQALDQERLLERLADVACVTQDGVPVAMLANIEQPAEAEEAMRVGADGIGLFRSEFLFLNRMELPGEDEQYAAYRQVAETMQGRPVTIRTIDVGSDKLLNGQSGIPGVSSPLGQRAIRYSLADPAVFLVQLRALLRASAHGPIQMLLPMLSHPREIDAVMALVAQAREDLRTRGEPQAERVPVGGMIEVPSAALSAGTFARKLDFLSIGTNDLIQYTLAIDRTDHRVAHLYDELHPAVLRLIALTIRSARKAGRPVTLCGEMAGGHQMTPLLLGMGLKSFSVMPARLLRVKQAVLRSDTRRLTPLVRRMLVQDDPASIRLALERLGLDPDAPRADT